MSRATMSSSTFDLNNFKLLRVTRDCRRFEKRVKRRDEVCFISCDSCFTFNVPCMKMSSGRGRLTCAECWRRGVLCVLMSWNVVERSMDTREKNLNEAEAEVRDLQDKLFEVFVKVRRRKRELELTQFRIDE